jgi:flagellar hook-associated protein 3 FlgL
LRITHRTIADTVNFNLQRSLSRLERYSHQLSTGKAFDRPSQNPVGVGRVMAYSAAIGRNEQYRLNMGEIQGWLESGETALSSGLHVLQQVRQLTIYAANSVVSAAERHSQAAEADGLYRQMVSVANSELNGLYIFAGHNTLTRPFELDAGGVVQYHGDGGQRVQEISAHQEVAMNLSGAQAFGPGQEVFNAVAQAAEAMRNQDLPALSGAVLTDLDRAIDLLLQNISELGGRSKRADDAYNILFGESISLEAMRSGMEDIDIARTITDYQMQESAYRATLATAARMLQPSLVDFLR